MVRLPGESNGFGGGDMDQRRRADEVVRGLES